MTSNASSETRRPNYRPGYVIAGQDVYLKLEQHVTNPRNPDYVPVYSFGIYKNGTDRRVGGINFRSGSNEHIDFYAGNIGYTIIPLHRGNAYAAKACALLKDFIHTLGFESVIITCNPDNLPSKRICEKIGARYIDHVKIPKYDALYRIGEREKYRFEWRVGDFQDKS